MGDAARVFSPYASPASAGRAASAEALSPPAGNEPLAIDENPEDDDLWVHDGDIDTASIKSNILRYREENGRTYHAYKDGSYLFPNDDAENERLELQHILCRLTLDDRLHAAPLRHESPRVLDVGCGTGIWSIEFADENPDAHVTGIDLSPIQPSFIPPNVYFLIDDAEEDLTFSTPFDFIFARMMTGSIKDFPKFFRHCFKNLSPGGFIELQDCVYPLGCDDDSMPPGTSIRKWSEMLNEAFRSFGQGMDSALLYEEQLAQAGFVNIRVVREKWPVSHWPRNRKYKQLGKEFTPSASPPTAAYGTYPYHYVVYFTFADARRSVSAARYKGILTNENFVTGISAGSLAAFTRPKGEDDMGWSRAEVEVLLAGVRADLRNTNIHAYLPFWVVYAQKPE